MAGDLIAAVVGLALAAAIVYTRHGSRISHAVMLAAIHKRLPLP